MLQSTVLVLLLSPEHGLAPMPDGVGLVQVRVSVMVWLPVPHVLEHSVRPDSTHCDHPPCTDTERVWCALHSHLVRHMGALEILFIIIIMLK